LVQFYIANYKNLKQVSILLKRFLALHSFNIPYNGGLSSYSTVILLVAYMNYYGLKNGVSDGDMSPSRLLLGFLDFYGNYFNPGSMGISVYEDG
jgi:DNA polymerase sigma